MQTPENAIDLTQDRCAPISVHIVYALPDTVWRRTVQLARSGTVRDALNASGFFDAFSDCQADTIQVGIYGQQCSLSRILNQNDRLEIYRPLVFDPMESRRRRARHKRNARG